MKGFFENLGFFANRFNQAIVITIELSIISLIAATIIGIIVGLVNTSKSKSVIMKILKAIANLYIYIIRGTPMLVQILIIYFGLGQMLRPTGFRWLNIGGTFTAGTVAYHLMPVLIWQKSSEVVLKQWTKDRLKQPDHLA